MHWMPLAAKCMRCMPGEQLHLWSGPSLGGISTEPSVTYVLLSLPLNRTLVRLTASFMAQAGTHNIAFCAPVTIMNWKSPATSKTGLRERTQDKHLHQPSTVSICHLHLCLKPQEADAKLPCHFCGWLWCVVASNACCVSVLLVTMNKQTGETCTAVKSCLLNMYCMTLNFFRLSSMITICWLGFLFSFLFWEFATPKSNLISFELGFYIFVELCSMKKESVWESACTHLNKIEMQNR